MGITVLEVTKKFGDFVALDDVSVAIPEGSLTALLGPSGSGKSTLLRVIAGLEDPDGGQVLLGDDDVTHQPARARGVGMVFQHYAAFKHMTVWDNVAFGLKIRKRSRADIKQRVHELLELVQLEGLAKRYPAQLSGGQRQRMALARALAVEPQVLLLDEPFGALDARVHDEVHVTTIIVTHDQEEAMEVAGQIVVINHGRVEQVGTPRQLYESPANEFVMSFVGPVNKIGETFVRPRDITVSLEPEPDSTEAMVERVVHLGFEVRAELVRDDGQHLLAQLTQEEVEALELERGLIVYVRPGRQTVFRR
jgi:sulfate/thiosulfate transport system ATP-binding protein